MKATGIVRRIDDLGRVVIPKEIRRTMRIREGDPLEIYTAGNGEVIFKKYSPMGEMSSIANDFCAAISQNTKLCVAICDRDRCIAATINKKELLEKSITQELEALVEQRKFFVDNNDNISCVKDNDRTVCAMCPVISAGDIVGCVCLLKSDVACAAEESDIKLIRVTAGFLSIRTE